MRLPIPEPIVPVPIRALLTALGFSGDGRALTPYLFVLTTIATWPIAYLMRYIPNRLARFVIAFSVGLCVLIVVYGVQTTAIFWVTCSVLYLPSYHCWLSPSIITVLALFLCLMVHYDGMISGTATDRFSHTGTMMMVTAKISMFAFHISDGRKLKLGKKLSPTSHIALDREKTAITEKVSYLEYMGYQFEFLGGVVGPLFGYKEFIDFIGKRGEFRGIDSVPVMRPFLRSSTRAFFVMSVYVVCQSFPLLHYETLITDRFAGLPIWTRLPLAVFILALSRLAFYAVWSLTEVTCVVCGIAFHHASNTHSRATNAHILLLETSPNVSQMTTCWNMRISKLWLKECVYQRVEQSPVGFIGKKALANFVTKITSALWHGLYAGYYVSFLSLGVANWTETVVRKKIHHHIPARILNSRLASFIAWAHTWVSVSIFFGPFLLLTWDKVTVYFAHIGMGVLVYHFCLIAIATWLVPSTRKHNSHVE